MNVGISLAMANCNEEMNCSSCIGEVSPLCLNKYINEFIGLADPSTLFMLLIAPEKASLLLLLNLGSQVIIS